MAPHISGSAFFCEEATYEISNLPSGCSVSWQVEREYLNYIDGGGTPYWETGTETYLGNEITLNSSNGNMPEKYNITATITNSSGVFTQLTKNVYSGVISQYAHTLDWYTSSTTGTSSYNNYSPQYLSLYAGETTDINCYSVSGNYYFGMAPQIESVYFADGSGSHSYLGSNISVTPGNNASGSTYLHVAFENDCGYGDYDHGFIIPCFIYSSGYYSLSPNPASDFIEISVTPENGSYTQKKVANDDSTKKIHSIRIFNKLGIEVLSQEYKNGLDNVHLNVSHLSLGYYNVVISDGKSIETKKLIVK